MKTRCAGWARLERRLALAMALLGAAIAPGVLRGSGETVPLNAFSVPPGATVTITFEVEVDNPLGACATAVSNQGTVSGVNLTSFLTDDPDAAGTANPTVTPLDAIDLSITKTDGAASEIPGTSVTYTIVASNSGPNGAAGVTVAASFPATLTGCSTTSVAAGGATGNDAGPVLGDLNDTGISLPSGASVTYTATCTIAASATGTLANTATVAAGVGATDTIPGNNSATDSDTLTPQTDLAITKTDGSATEVPGTTVTYTIVASNAGPSNAVGATVADTFPATISAITWTCVGALGGTCPANGAGNLNATVDLPAGGAVTFTATGTIASSATGTLVNTATVTAGGGATDPSPGNNSATDTDTLTPQANVAITKSDGVTAAVPGTNTTYTLVASNAGPSNAPAAPVADTFPAACASVNWTCAGAGGGSCPASGTGNLNLAVGLPTGGSVVFSAVCAIDPAATGTLVNTATVAPGAGVTDPTPGNNSATDTDTLTPQADVSVTKTVDPTAANNGDTATFTIVVANAGPSTVIGVAVEDHFPPALQSDLAWTCVAQGGATCTAAGTGDIVDTVDLPPGSSVTYTATCTVYSATDHDVTNTATATLPAGVTDPDTGDQTDSVTISINAFTIQEIPTLDARGLALLALLIAAAGWLAVRRQG